MSNFATKTRKPKDQAILLRPSEKQRYLPEGVEGGWYQPQGHGFEQDIIERLANLRREEE